jgi:hypothetical protein
MAIYDFFLSRNNAASTPSNYVGHTGRLFYESTTGEIKISDGATLGGVAIPITLATTTIAGGVKLGPGVVLNSQDQIIINSTGLDFSFGDFQATTPLINGSNNAVLSSINANQDISLVSNGTGVVEVVGDFHVHAPSGTLAATLANEEIFRVSATGKIRMLVPLADEVEGALTIVGNAAAEYHPPNQAGVIMHATGQTNGIARHYLDANNNYPIIVGRRYNGTYDAPTPILNGEIIVRLVGQASTNGQFETFGPCRIEMRATQDQATGAQGGEIAYFVTPLDTAAANAVEVMKFNAETGVTTVDVNPQVTGTYDLGSTALRWRNVYTDTMNLVGNTLTTVNPATNIVIGDTDSTGITDMTNRAVEITDLTVTNPIVGNGSQLTNLPKPTVLTALSSSPSVFAENAGTLSTITNMTLSPPAGTYLASFSSEYISTLTGSVTATAAADLATLYTQLQNLTATVTNHAAAFGSGETLGPGVYTVPAAWSIAGTLTLNGGPTDLFVFRGAGAFTTSNTATIVLTGGATSNNVFWVSQGAVSSGTNAVLKGSFIANQAANDLGAGLDLEGRVLTINGAISINTATITEPTGTINSSLTLGTIDLFSVFAAIGAITSVGTSSNIALSIGSNSAAVTGFAAPNVVGGTIYSSTDQLSVIQYGIYIDNVLIPNSFRTQSQTRLVSGWPMSIQTIATVTAGQVVSVKTIVPTGGFTIGPAMALILIPTAT